MVCTEGTLEYGQQLLGRKKNLHVHLPRSLAPLFDRKKVSRKVANHLYFLVLSIYVQCTVQTVHVIVSSFSKRQHYSTTHTTTKTTPPTSTPAVSLRPHCRTPVPTPARQASLATNNATCNYSTFCNRHGSCHTANAALVTNA